MKSFLRNIGYIFIVYLVLSGLINLLRQVHYNTTPCREYSSTDNTSLDRDHFRNWQLLQTNKQFCANYHSFESISQQRGVERNEIASAGLDYNNYWGSVYQHLVNQNKPYIRFIADSLQRISVNEKFDRTEFASLVVSFVQDIPYSYVMGNDCENVKKSKHPCVGNMAFGILSPYEFLHTLYGDCDTRAVLLYALLEDLGFRPMIVVSNEYAHAMLALDIPSAGQFIMHKRDKFYFWETTATGWTAGMLPPDMNNINYWKIALVNEL